jgi:hypothetical protein
MFSMTWLLECSRLLHNPYQVPQIAMVMGYEGVDCTHLPHISQTLRVPDGFRQIKVACGRVPNWTLIELINATHIGSTFSHPERPSIPCRCKGESNAITISVLQPGPSDKQHRSEIVR